MRTRSSISRLRRRISSPPSVVCSRMASAIWAPILSAGFSDIIGSWNTMPIRGPRSLRMAASGSVVSSCPWKRIEPALTAAPGGSRRSTARASMVFPEPDSPTSPCTSPARISRSARSIAGAERPKRTVSPSIASTGRVAAACAGIAATPLTVRASVGPGGRAARRRTGSRRAASPRSRGRETR